MNHSIFLFDIKAVRFTLLHMPHRNKWFVNKLNSKHWSDVCTKTPRSVISHTEKYFFYIGHAQYNEY